MPTTPTLRGDNRSFVIIGAGMEVHTVLGPKLFEIVYQDALSVEFEIRKIPFVREVQCPVDYKGHRLRGHYRADFLCFDEVIVEVKAQTAIGPADEAQILNYLKASGKQVGLLLNFGMPRLEYRRFVLGWKANSNTPGSH